MAGQANPWDNDPVVAPAPGGEAPAPEGQYRSFLAGGAGDKKRVGDNGRPYDVVSQTLTVETPEDLASQGYQQDSSGTWFKVVGERTPSYGETATQSQDLTTSIQADQTEGAQRAGSWARGVTEMIPFMDEGVAKLVSMTQGVPYDEVRQVQNEQVAYDKENRSGSRMAGQGTGFAVGLAAPGGAYVRGAQGLAQVGRAGAVGAGYGALYGLGAGEGGLAERAPGAAIGAIAGGLGGAGLQAAGNTIARRISGIAGAGQRPPAPVRGDPETRAAIRLSNSMGPGAVTERGRLGDLGVQPSLMDVSGGTTERLIRMAAAPAGEGANTAVANAGARQAGLRPEVMARTRELLPDQRSAAAIRDGLEEARDALATVEYAPAYEGQVSLTPAAARALRGPDGQAAIQRAMLGARANGDVETLAEMQQLLTQDLDALPSVSGRTLDRVRIAMRDMGQNFMRGDRPDRVRAAGYAGRVGGIDDALDSAPGLTEARSAYRERSGAIDAIDNRPDILSTDPRDFGRWVQGLTPQQRSAAVAGVRQDIMDALGGQRSAGSGSLDTLTQSQYSQQNLAALLGEEEAARYLQSIAARVQQSQRAQRVSPNTNSQTFGRALDESTFQAAEVLGAVADGVNSVRGNVPAIARTIDRIRARATMSSEEREAIVRMGLGSAQELERIILIADQARSRGGRVPREVLGFLDGVEANAGAEAALALRNALLPAPLAASEQEPPQ